MNALAIQTHSLTKVFTGVRGATRAVDGLSLSVPEGAIYGLLGRNSAGKTTTIRMLMGLARPTSGSSRIFGLDPMRERERVSMLSLVGYVPEDKALLGLPARKLFELNRCFYAKTWSDDLARKAVERLELPIDTPFLKLSMGNKTKSALITAIAQRSRLLILDEPTSGLDPVALDALLRLLVEDCTADGRTILVSSHQLLRSSRSPITSAFWTAANCSWRTASTRFSPISAALPRPVRLFPDPAPQSSAYRARATPRSTCSKAIPPAS